MVGVEVERRGPCPAPRRGRRSPRTVVWLWVPCTQVLVTRHLNLAPAGSAVSASRAPSRNSTSTPLSTGVVVVDMVVAPLVGPAPVPARRPSQPRPCNAACSPTAGRLQGRFAIAARHDDRPRPPPSSTASSRPCGPAGSAPTSTPTTPGSTPPSPAGGSRPTARCRSPPSTAAGSPCPSVLETVERLPIEGGEVVRYLHTFERRRPAARRPPRAPPPGARRPDRGRHGLLRRPLGTRRCSPRWDRRRMLADMATRLVPRDAAASIDELIAGATERPPLGGTDGKSGSHARARRHRRRALRPQAPAPRRRLDDARLRRPRLPARRGVDLGPARRGAADHRPRRRRRGRGPRPQRLGRRAPAARRQRAPRPRGRHAAVARGPPPAARPPRRPVGHVLGRRRARPSSCRSRAGGARSARAGWRPRSSSAGPTRCRASPPTGGRASPSGRRPTCSRSSTACATTSTRSCGPCARRRSRSCTATGSSATSASRPGRTVLLDWTYPGIGPIAHDLAWYLSLNRARLPESKEESIDALRGSLEHRGIDTDRLVGAAGGALPARRARAVRLGEGAGRRRRARLVVRSGPGGGAPAVSLGDAYSATGAAWRDGPERVYERLADVLVAASPVPLAGRAGRRRRRRHRRRQPRHRSGRAAAPSRVDLADGHARGRPARPAARPSWPTPGGCRWRRARARPSSRRSRFNHVPDPERRARRGGPGRRPRRRRAGLRLRRRRHPPGEGRGRDRAAPRSAGRADPWIDEMRGRVDPRARHRRPGPRPSPRRAGLDATAEAVAVPFPDLDARRPRRLAPRHGPAWPRSSPRCRTEPAAASRPAPSTSSAPIPSPSSAASIVLTARV